MGNGALAVAIFILPSALWAESGHRSPLASRPASRKSSTVVHKPAVGFQTAPTRIAPVTTTLKSNPATVSPTARADAIRGLTATTLRPFFPAPASARSDRGRSRGYNNGSIRSRAYGARRADAPQTESPPPYLYTPGALIRTEGLGYTATPTNDTHWQTTAPGYAIVQDPAQSVLLDPFPGIHVGPADRMTTSAASAGGRASGRNAITPNAVSFSDSDSGGSSGSGEHNRDQGGKPDDPNENGNGNGHAH